MNKRLRKKKGVSKIQNSEVWSLDYTLSKFILPRLIKFKEINTMSYPCRLSGMEEWHQIIDKMIWSFDAHLKDNRNTNSLDKENKRFEEGMNLFSEYYCDLWD